MGFKINSIGTKKNEHYLSSFHRIREGDVSLINGRFKEAHGEETKLMSDIIIISGSPFPESRTDLVLQHMGEVLEDLNFQTVHYSVTDVPPEDLIGCDFNSPKIREITKAILNAKGIVIGSPVYKATYSGVLKTLIDLLPQDVFADKFVMPMMTGGTEKHLLAMEYMLKPLLANLKAHALKGVYLVEDEINTIVSERLIRDEQTDQRLKKQLEYFSKLIRSVNN